MRVCRHANRVRYLQPAEPIGRGDQLKRSGLPNHRNCQLNWFYNIDTAVGSDKQCFTIQNLYVGRGPESATDGFNFYSIDGTQPYGNTIFINGAVYTYCAMEGQFCRFNGVAELAFGADNGFVFTAPTQPTGTDYFGVKGVSCAASSFGSVDPQYGTVKACYYRLYQ